jgi:hypothetical protein
MLIWLASPCVVSETANVPLAGNEGETENPLRKAVRLAREAGWAINPPALDPTTELLVLHLAIDHNFWQALASVEHWPDWEPYRQDFIDHLAGGESATSFFGQILK